MSDAIIFKDLPKKAQDLFKKDFPAEKTFEVTTKADNGVKFVANLKNKDTSIEGSFNPKIEIESKGLEISPSINNNNEFKVEVIAKKLLTGLKHTLTATAGKELTLNSAAEYKHEYGAATYNLDIYHETRPPILSVSALVGHNGFYVGASADYRFGEVYDWAAVNSILGYSKKNYTFTGQASWSIDNESKEKQSVHSTLFYDMATLNTQVGVLVDYNLTASSNAIDVSIAASKKVDDTTTVKAKYDTKGILGLSFVQKVTKNVKLTAGGEFNTKDLSAAGKHKWGLGIALEEL